MTLQACGQTYWPTPIGNFAIGTGGGSLNTITFDSTTDRLAYIGKYYGSADSIASVRFRVGAIAATAGTGVKVRIESVSNGRPSGTLWSANGTGAAPSASVIIADTDDNTFKTATLTNAANLIAGDEFAIVIIYEAGNDDGTFSVLFNTASGNLTGALTSPGMYPVCLQDTGAGSWIAVINPLVWIVTMTTAGVIYMPWLSPMSSGMQLSSMNNGAASDERALRFQIPITARAIGMMAYLGNVTAAGDFQFALWSSTGALVGDELAVTSLEDGDVFVSTTNDGYVILYFNAPYTLAANTTYYAGVKSLSTNAFVLFEFVVAAAGDLAALPLSSTSQIYGAVRTWDETATPDSAGAWTTSTTTLPLISLIIDQLDDGAGGGAASVQYRSNMSGGL